MPARKKAAVDRPPGGAFTRLPARSIPSPFRPEQLCVFAQRIVPKSIIFKTPKVPNAEARQALTLECARSFLRRQP